MTLRRGASLHFINWAVVLTVMVALAFQGWGLWEGHQRALALMETRAANRAQATAHRVEAIFRDADLALLGVRDHLDPREIREGPSPRTLAKGDAMRAFLCTEASRVPQILLLHVIAADGRFVYSSNPSLPTHSIDYRTYFQAQRDAHTDEVRISEPIFGRVSGQWGVFASRRLVDGEGRFAGIILASLDARTMGESMVAVDQQNWILSLFDGEQRLVARTPPGLMVIGAVAGDSRLDIHGGAPSSFIGAGLGETSPQIWGVQPLRGLPLFTVAGYSRDLALVTWRRDLRIHGAVALLLVVCCLGISVVMARAERARKDLLVSEAYFRTLFETVPDAVAVVCAGKVVDANEGYWQLFQVPQADPTPPWDLAPSRQPDGAHTRDQGLRLVQGALRGTLQRRPWQCMRADGSLFDCEMTVARFQHGGADRLMAIVRDLSEIRKVEEALHQAHKLDALGQLAGGIAHDFNNMLSAILSSADLLREEVTTDHKRKLAGTIFSAAERAGQLTRQLLAFARKGKILSTATDLHQILEEVVALLERTIDRRISLQLRLEAPCARVIGDPSQLQNAILNLGVNARDAMPEGGRIVFETTVVHLEGEACHLGTFHLEPGEYLHLAVADNGCGIPEGNLARIFDPFFTTKDVNKGTGLGLAALFGTMISHRGAVTVESRVGVGSLFHLFLPLAVGEALRGTPAAGHLPRGNARVLLVDDEDLVRSATAMALESLGHSVHEEADGQAAIDYFRLHHGEIDAVIMDLVMPHLSGSQATQAMRGIDPSVPIIMASGFPRNAEINQLLEEGAAGFIQKPLDRTELGRLLAQVQRIVT